ncbi:helix-turn-helix domain-containing protein [Acetobacterium wieringae]|jgi:transcriptional regulator with XRE-family HTH domain|uniref:HTH-type transcriptional regulator Xre n=1 Tax=Acetobacterium wieringae TaxID=52694 RepID=A0A1F2PKZ3_9FIRM|nr:helix-turn-helix domain-containing protein [Acetobacterium wieringae]OFV71534.1 HTH-type transcriptional regulator Xre [Acetobacterium wieringae]
MFPKILRKLRIKNKLTQTELGNIIGVSFVSISKYENEERQPELGTLIKLADYFQISLDDLIGRSIEKPSVETSEYAHKIKQEYSIKLTKNQKDLLDIYDKIEDERLQIKLLGKFENIVENMIIEKKKKGI